MIVLGASALTAGWMLLAVAQTNEPAVTPSSQGTTQEAALPPKRVRLVFAGIRGEMKDNVARAVKLRGLIRRDDATDALVERAYRQAPEQIRLALAPFGYDQPDIQSTIAKEGDTYRIRFAISPGPPTVVSSLEVQVKGAEGDEEIKAALARFSPGVGATLVHADYEAAKADIQRLLQSHGYFQATLAKAKVGISRSRSSADIELEWDAGPRYRFGPLVFEGGQLEPELLQRYRSFAQGGLYNQTRLLELQQRLTDADYFSSIEVSVEPEDADPQTLEVPVIVRLEAAKRNIYTGGVSFGTDSGAGVKGGVERRYVNSWGHKALAQAEYSQNLQAAGVSYRIPRYADYRSFYGATAQLRNEQTSTFESDTLRLSAEFVDIWHGWERSASLNLLSGDFTIGGRIEDGGDQGSSTLLYPELRVKRRDADDFSRPRRGWSALLYLRGAAESVLSDTSMAQIGGEGRWITSLSDRQRLLFRAAVGATWVDDFDQLPPDLRYYAGGDLSLRGYGYQDLGPTNVSGKVVGGRYLLTGSAEYEYALNDRWGVAGFVDAGNAYSNDQFEPEVGVGFGLRWNSPVGLVRLDIAFPVDDFAAPRPHLVIGPDL